MDRIDAADVDSVGAGAARRGLPMQRRRRLEVMTT